MDFNNPMDMFVSHGHVHFQPSVNFCDVCAMPHGHPDMPRAMGVFGVDGSFFCSMDCHDSVQCRRQAVVFVFVHDGMGNDGQFVDVACHGPQANVDFRCPDCDFRANQR
jgi:hypothetical protein